MPNILIRDVSQKTVSRLKTRAKQHNRTLPGEVKHLIEESAQMSMDEARLRAARIRASFGKKKFSDSAELLREGRGR